MWQSLWRHILFKELNESILKDRKLMTREIMMTGEPLRHQLSSHLSSTLVPVPVFQPLDIAAAVIRARDRPQSEGE